MLTQERLKELLHYDKDTGVFTRKIKLANGIQVGDIAGCVDGVNGYIVIIIDGKNYRAHRLAWLYVNGGFPKEQIDHISHDRTDNKIANLRSVTNQENQMNKSMLKNNTSGFTGVYWHKPTNKWQSQIMINGKYKHLGYFTNKNDAIKARKEANIEFGFHQNHGS